MKKPVVLRGYQFSVYNRIVRIALHEKGISYETEEIDPFASNIPADYLKRHPFRCVPVLSHGAFDVYETAAILRYIDAAFNGPALMPVGAKPLTRVAQVVSIMDSYGYRPMVRQVFAQRVFCPAVGEESDETEVAIGIKASLPVLDALNTLASEGNVLNGKNFTLADCHLAPMVAYFIQAPEGAKELTKYSALADWWARISQRKSIKATDPGLPPG
ncbi:glutathione S-transferase family protein [Rhodobacteraceae bacterium B1Z28]|uniref:glutathione transferase n=1 Tax=Ruegeria haliotis TaxID=2747601 RepID=A0ABX2PM92_9RHOB|nr:glutathione S-transferase family protein [Ruegeria haliotis]NVO55240.1 glutathione S-transferase family protein [Ruegeria haliotis]